MYSKSGKKKDIQFNIYTIHVYKSVLYKLRVITLPY